DLASARRAALVLGDERYARQGQGLGERAVVARAEPLLELGEGNLLPAARHVLPRRVHDPLEHAHAVASSLLRPTYASSVRAAAPESTASRAASTPSAIESAQPAA